MKWPKGKKWPNDKHECRRCCRPLTGVPRLYCRDCRREMAKESRLQARSEVLQKSVKRALMSEFHIDFDGIFTKTH